MPLRRSSSLNLLFGVFIGSATLTLASAQDGWSYKNRTITIYSAGTAGGGYDFYSRLLARHLGKHLPGNPAVVVKNMPGAGGVVLANYLHVRAARDGTEFAALEHGTAFTPLLTRARVEFDPAKFGWLGSMEQFTPIAAVWHTVPVYSADDLMTTPINVGTAGAGSTTSGYPHSLNAILGTKMRVIQGYPGSAEVNLAIERGELDGVASWCWTCLKGQKPHWVAEKKLRVVMQLAPVGDPELTAMNIPTVFERAKTDEQRQMLNIVFGSVALSRPYRRAARSAARAARTAAQGVRGRREGPGADRRRYFEGLRRRIRLAGFVEDIVRRAFAADPALIEKVRNAYSGK